MGYARAALRRTLYPGQFVRLAETRTETSIGSVRAFAPTGPAVAGRLAEQGTRDRPEGPRTTSARRWRLTAEFTLDLRPGDRVRQISGPVDFEVVEVVRGGGDLTGVGTAYVVARAPEGG